MGHVTWSLATPFSFSLSQAHTRPTHTHSLTHTHTTRHSGSVARLCRCCDAWRYCCIWSALRCLLQRLRIERSRLQVHTATHCDTLQHTATYYNTLQHTAIHCNTLQHSAAHCSTLQCTAWRYDCIWSALDCLLRRCSVLPCVAVCCSVLSSYLGSSLCRQNY